MIIAHLPTGYILGSYLQNMELETERKQRILQVALVGSVLPDLDMLYWFWVDRSLDHHLFYTHIPAVYCLLIPIFVLCRQFKQTRFIGNLLLTLWLALLSHAILDTVVSGILWTFPFTGIDASHLIHLVDKEQIPKVVNPYHVYVDVMGLKLEGWVLNLMLHWSALIEYVLCGVAFTLYTKRKGQVKSALSSDEGND